LIGAAGHEVVDLVDAGIPERAEEDALEVGTTFEDNALAKATYFARVSGMPTLADDSGLEVEALGGAPGVLSKRWSGREDLSGQALDDANNRLLLTRLAGLENRAARYVCAAACSGLGPELVVRGETAGSITEAPAGSGGFGYDPYFLSAELGRTFGSVSMEEKALVSHRARAFAKLLRHIAEQR
jgi:XTP/dITP diphosphohydrolase